jgi:hypothetical protein
MGKRSCGAHSASVPVGTGVPWVQISQDIKLTADLHVVVRLRIHGAVHLPKHLHVAVVRHRDNFAYFTRDAALLKKLRSVSFVFRNIIKSEVGNADCRVTFDLS